MSKQCHCQCHGELHFLISRDHLVLTDADLQDSGMNFAHDKVFSMLFLSQTLLTVMHKSVLTSVCSSSPAKGFFL